MIRARSRIRDEQVVAAPAGTLEKGHEYNVCEQPLEKGAVIGSTNVPYANARSAVQRFMVLQNRWRVHLGDVEFTDKDGTVAVTWRHLKANLRTLQWILEDDGTVFSELLEKAKGA